MSDPVIRAARGADRAAMYDVCLRTGDHGRDAASIYRDDPDALGRIFVGPYLALEPELSFVLEDAAGVCGYVLGALDSRAFYRRYDVEWRPQLCAAFGRPDGDPERWTAVERVYDAYHQPDYFCPEPYAMHPSHAHIDLLPRAQGRGFGRRMMDQLTTTLRRRGSPGVHLGVSALNTRAHGFYQRLGFAELTRTGSGEGTCVYMGMRLD